MGHNRKVLGNAVMTILQHCDDLAGNGIDDNLSEIQSALDTARSICNMHELREIQNVEWVVGYINHEAKELGLLDRVK